jgi:hypothetical protein
MFDSAGRLTLTDDQRVKAIESIMKGDMPKGKPLTSSEKLQVMSLLSK